MKLDSKEKRMVRFAFQCMQRILGAGNAEGSVGGGGFIRRNESGTD